MPSRQNGSPSRPADTTERRAPCLVDIHDWLLTQALQGRSMGDIVAGLGRRLVTRGIPVQRMCIGGVVLHPVFGALDTIWDADTNRIRCEHHPRSAAGTAEFQNTPFFMMAAGRVPYRRFRLDGGPSEAPFPILQALQRAGMTDYITFFHGYGASEEHLFAELAPGTRGANVSFATRRAGGFSDLEIEQLRMLTKPLAAASKAANGFELSRGLLDTYLGRLSGEQVLRGQVERGDGQQIDCVLWYCDLRSSTRIAESMSLDALLATLNVYFEAAADAVLDHGGEVLKFIGDAVMAIFPVDDQERPLADMCNAALAAAHDAQTRLAAGNAERLAAGAPPLELGVALHVGRVLYGNVGTGRRLDFTVVGPAVNEAVRLEKLCKSLGEPILASAAFKESCPRELVALGRHPAFGVSADLDVFAPARSEHKGV